MAYGILHDFLTGQTTKAYEYFGAHFTTQKIDGREVDGVVFRLYAPLARDVSVVGDWNSWDVGAHKMNKIDSSGVFEIFIPHLKNYANYKYHFKNAKGIYVDKADPFAFYSELRPGTCSRLFDYRNFIWHDSEYLKHRTRNFDKPVSIYEIHLGSWKGAVNGKIISYEQIADYIIPYVKNLGFTHVEIMPITQYPFDGSWGYQATGFYSVDSRYGNPMQLMSFIDRLHQAGIGVILDFAPVHFANDSFGLIEFDGTHLYEYDNDLRVSPWGSLQFDLGKDPVRSFLMSAINYFISVFHVDGIRVDAVSNIIFYHGNKKRGTNDGAIEFIKRLNGKIHLEHSSVMMIAEDSSDYYGVTKPLEHGGLGFDYKWDLGWMNDTLKYYSLDPVYKKFDHHKFTFSMAYFFNENFLLPFSHDEVVHGKGTLINKLHGTYEEKFALLRNLFTYQFAHPGKKLNFMGNELGSFDEWDEAKSLPWQLKKFPAHDSITRLIRDLNLVYRYEKAMHVGEHHPMNFRWLLVDNADESVFAFSRSHQNEKLIFVFNMTPNFYENYQVPVEEEGVYEEIFNSDKDVYGGKNQYNGLKLKTERFGKENKPYHLNVKLASFGAMIFKKTTK
ncbi:MAG: 1,4-alpha-glucan branching protein GlgB [Bacilli bacterium]|jgi:1,4-alpha-glucan branching enzyme|nr:1,4-alpha-glucan branching protein GlgB [Bacilli bacterium]